MKQHITPKQFKQMDVATAVRLFDLVPRKDWFKFHHKKVTIGKMIELLKDIEEESLLFILEDFSYQIASGVNYELCDQLWDRLLTSSNQKDI